MKVKLETLPDLAKAVGGLGGHFRKSASHHEALAKASAELSKLHADHAVLIKTKHDGMDDSHEMKAHFAKEHEFHKAAAEKCDEMGKMYKTYADEETAAADGIDTGDEGVSRAAAGAKPQAKSPAGNAQAAADSVSGMVDTTVNAVVAKSLETIQTDPEIQARIQEAVLNIINAKLGDKIVPDHVRGALPDVPLAEGSASAQNTLVRRPGQSSVDTSTVPAEFAHLVEA